MCCVLRPCCAGFNYISNAYKSYNIAAELYFKIFEFVTNRLYKSSVQREKTSVQKTSFCLTSSRVDMRQRYVPTLFVALVLQKHISDIWLIQKLYSTFSSLLNGIYP